MESVHRRNKVKRQKKVHTLVAILENPRWLPPGENFKYYH